MDILDKLYTTVVSLEDWLYRVDRTGALQTTLRQSGDTRSYETLLTSVYVCTSGGQSVQMSLDRQYHLPDIVLAIIRVTSRLRSNPENCLTKNLERWGLPWSANSSVKATMHMEKTIAGDKLQSEIFRMLNKSGPQSNVLTHGCVLSSSARFPYGVESFQPNSILDRLFSADWRMLHSRIGDEILTCLLEKMSVFENIGRGCFVQFAGFPIYERWPYGKSLSVDVKLHSSCKSDPAKHTDKHIVAGIVERVISKHQKRSKRKMEKRHAEKRRVDSKKENRIDTNEALLTTTSKISFKKKRFEDISDPKYESLRHASVEYRRTKSTGVVGSIGNASTGDLGNASIGDLCNASTGDVGNASTGDRSAENKRDKDCAARKRDATMAELDERYKTHNAHKRIKFGTKHENERVVRNPDGESEVDIDSHKMGDECGIIKIETSYMTSTLNSADDKSSVMSNGRELDAEQCSGIQCAGNNDFNSPSESPDVLVAYKVKIDTTKADYKDGSEEVNDTVSDSGLQTDVEETLATDRKSADTRSWRSLQLEQCGMKLGSKGNRTLFAAEKSIEKRSLHISKDKICNQKTSKPFNHSVTIPRNSVLFSMNVRQRIHKSELLATVDITPEGILRLYREIFVETSVLLTGQCVNAVTPDLRNLQRLCCPNIQRDHVVREGGSEEVMVLGNSNGSIVISSGGSIKGTHSSGNTVLKGHPSFGDGSFEHLLGSYERNSAETEFATDNLNICESVDTEAGDLIKEIGDSPLQDLGDVGNVTRESKRVGDLLKENCVEEDLQGARKESEPLGVELDVSQLHGLSAEHTGLYDGSGSFAVEKSTKLYGGIERFTVEESTKLYGGIERFTVEESTCEDGVDLATSGDSHGFDVEPDTERSACEDIDVGADGDSEGFNVELDTDMDISSSQSDEMVLVSQQISSSNTDNNDVPTDDADKGVAIDKMFQERKDTSIANKIEEIKLETNDTVMVENDTMPCLVNSAPATQSGKEACQDPATDKGGTSETKAKDEVSLAEIFIPALDDVVPLLEEFIQRHRKCRYHTWVKYYCPVNFLQRTCVRRWTGRVARFRAAMNRKRLSTGLLLNSHSSYRQVYLFLRRCLRTTVPFQLLGSVHNFNVLLKNVSVLVSLKRFDKISIGRIMQGMKTLNIPWLRRVCPNEKRLLLLACLVYWLVTHYVLVIIKTFFYVTDTSFLRYRLLYFRQNVWVHLHNNGVRDLLQKKTLARITKTCAQDLLVKRSSLGISSLRFLPKQKSLRPIINMQVVDPSFTNQKYSINTRLSDAHQVLMWLKSRNSSFLGYGKLGQDSIHDTWSGFVERWRSMGQPRLYWVKSDISHCYDSIVQWKLLAVLEAVLRKELGTGHYAVRRYFRLSVCQGRVRRAYRKAVYPELRVPDFVEFCKQQIHQNGLRNLIFIDKVTYPRETRQSLLNTLKAHLLHNIVQISSQYFIQSSGLSQGSIVSTMLCSMYYMDMEKRVFNIGPDDVLMRMVDDYLYVTPSRKKATEFITAVLKGIPEYNCVVNVDKVLTNFPVQFREKWIPQELSGWFPWCGVLFNTSTLEAGTDYRRYWATSVDSTMTHDLSKEPGCMMKGKLIFSARHRCIKIILDENINSRQQILRNIFLMFLLVSFKFHNFIRKLKQKASNPRFLIGVLFALRDCVSNQVHKKQVKCLGSKRRRGGIILWLCLKAFLLKLQRHRGQYSCLVSCCQACLGYTEHRLDEDLLRDLNEAAGVGMPVEFQCMLP